MFGILGFLELFLQLVPPLQILLVVLNVLHINRETFKDALDESKVDADLHHDEIVDPECYEIQVYHHCHGQYYRLKVFSV